MPDELTPEERIKTYSAEFLKGYSLGLCEITVELRALASDYATQRRTLQRFIDAMKED